MMQPHQPYAFLFTSIFAPVFLCLALAAQAKAGPGGNGNKEGPTKPTKYVPMTLDYERYFFSEGDGAGCLGEDDELEWEASGSLAPGESFSFTPQAVACEAHAAAVTVVATWKSGDLDLSAVVPDTDYSSWDDAQAGRQIIAPIVGESAQLCMFPAYSREGIDYTITLTNNSHEVVHGIHLNGRSENDWSVFYYPRCLNGDGDHDGWNDSLEHSMANLVYPNGYIDGVYQPYRLWGSNYLRATPETPLADDEIDSYPPDLNDDGRVDDLDRAILEGELGQGNGIPLEKISPNPGDDWFHENTLPWRRYDLDADGFVGPEDLEILGALTGMAVPMTADVVSPTARVTEPADGATVPRGEYVLIKAHVWDNAALAQVDYWVNGRSVCTVTDPVPDFGFTSPLYFCWWRVPKRAALYEVEVTVLDDAGNVGYSEPILVRAE